MADRELRLRVGAALDASFNTVMATIVESAKRARRQIATELAAGAKEGARAQVSAGKEASTAITNVAKTAKQQADAMAKDVLRTAKANVRDRVALEKAGLAEVERDLKAHNRARAALAKENTKNEDANKSKGSPRDLSRGGALLMRMGGAALGMGARMVGSAFGAMGVDTSLQGQMHGSIHREKMAVDIASQGYIGSGKGPKGSQSYTDPNAIMDQAKAVGNATGTETKDVLEGLDKFVKMTGDLETARNSMAEIGKIAKANGADMGDMMEAAANVSIAMGDMENKGPALGALMRTIAGQGHLGAVAIKDMASQMGKLTAQANFFKIDPMSAETLKKAGVTDEVGQRVAIMGAMAQYARAKGGRITSQQATQSSMAFIRDLANPTEVKRMKEQGLDVYADSGHTKVRDPLQMMLEVFKKGQVKGGVNRDIINRVFGNKQSRAVAEAMSQDYNKEYGNAEKSGITDETKKHQFAMEALTETFQNYLRVTQSNAEVQMKFDAAMNTTISKANIMNNNIGSVADQLKSTLMPALEALAPVLIDLAGAGANFLANMLGLDTGGDIKSYRAQRAASDAQGVGDKILKQAWDPSAPTTRNADGTTTREKVKITPEQVKQMNDALTLANKEYSAKGAGLAEEGKTHSGLLHQGKSYSEMSDKELKEEANSTLGDNAAKQYLKDKDHYVKLGVSIDALNSTVAKLADARARGLVQDVVIVGDKTATPPGAEPATSGTGDVDSSHQ